MLPGKAGAFGTIAIRGNIHLERIFLFSFFIYKPLALTRFMLYNNMGEKWCRFFNKVEKVPLFEAGQRRLSGRKRAASGLLMHTGLSFRRQTGRKPTGFPFNMPHMLRRYF